MLVALVTPTDIYKFVLVVYSFPNNPLFIYVICPVHLGFFNCGVFNDCTE